MVKQETEVHFELCTRYYLISLEAKHSYFPQYPVVLLSSAISIYHLQCKKHAVPSELKVEISFTKTIGYMIPNHPLSSHASKS